MERKKLLIILVTIIVLAGVTFSSIPFFSSMQPSGIAKANRPQYDISSLKLGSYRFEVFHRYNTWNQKVLIIKDWDGELYVHMVPTKDDKVVMPDRSGGWWGYYTCSNFGPEVDASQMIKKNGSITCHDKDAPEGMKKEWQWSYNGKSKSKWIDDTYAASYEINGSILYLNQ